MFNNLIVFCSLLVVSLIHNKPTLADQVPTQTMQYFSESLDVKYPDVSNSDELLKLQTNPSLQYMVVVNHWKKVANTSSDCSDVYLRHLIELDQNCAPSKTSKFRISRATYDHVKRFGEKCKNDIARRLDEQNSPQIQKLIKTVPDEVIQMILKQKCFKSGGDLCLEDTELGLHFRPSHSVWSQAKPILNKIQLNHCQGYLKQLHDLKLAASMVSKHTDLYSKLSDLAKQKMAIEMICDQLDQDSYGNQKKSGFFWGR